MQLRASSLTVSSSTFRRLSVNSIRGALYAVGSTGALQSANLSGSVFENCSTVLGGAAANLLTDSLRVVNSTFSHCTATGPMSCAQIAVNSSQLSMADSVFSDLQSTESIVQYMTKNFSPGIRPSFE